MSQFTGTYLNRLDAKGRVSVPAPFRAALRERDDEDAPVKLFLGPSRKHPCIEGWPKKRMDAVAARLEAMDPFSDEYEDLAYSIYGGTFEVEADREGRIVLSDQLRAKAELGSQAAFVGTGGWFQIWEPGAAERRGEQATAATRLRDQAKAGRPPA